jgi:hypothetical protein
VVILLALACKCFQCDSVNYSLILLVNRVTYTATAGLSISASSLPTFQEGHWNYVSHKQETFRTLRPGLNELVIVLQSLVARWNPSSSQKYKLESQKDPYTLTQVDKYKPIFTMTVSKVSSVPNMNKSAAKAMPNKAVSFSKACKFSFPAKQVSTSMQNDSFLQSTDNRRRYQRRGSKSPAMLQFSSDKVESIDKEEFSAEKANTEFLSNQGRRLSLMEALKIKFEKSAIIEPNVASKIRRLSLDQQRRYPHDLISKA